MKVIEYFSETNKDIWKNQIAGADRRAAHFLAELLDDIPKMEKLLGEDCKLFLLTEGDELISFASLTKRDCVDAPERFPWIGFVYTYPQYRNKGNSKYLLDSICEYADSAGYEKVWLATDRENLYEHYGFEFADKRMEVFDGGEDRVYCKVL